MRKLKKFASNKIIFVAGVISPTMGNVLYKIGRKSFKGDDIIDLLKEIRDVVGPDM